MTRAIIRVAGDHADLHDYIVWLCNRLGTQVGQGAIDHCVVLMNDLVRPLLLHPRGEAVPTLKKLKEAGLTIGLISDCSSEIPAIWRESPLAKEILNPVFSCEVACKKPAIEIYQEGLRRLGSAPEETMFVGDGRSNELCGALQAGLIPVLYRPPEMEEAYRPEAQEWNGRRVESLLSLLTLVN